MTEHTLSGLQHSLRTAKALNLLLGIVVVALLIFIGTQRDPSLEPAGSKAHDLFSQINARLILCTQEGQKQYLATMMQHYHGDPSRLAEATKAYESYRAALCVK